MNIKLKEYQEIGIEELIKKLKKLLDFESQKNICVFQSPTGSGKTLMTAKTIEGLIKEFSEEDFCFVWVSIGKGNLHLQSKYSLEKVFNGFPKISLVEEEFLGGRDQILKHEVVVVNWEKLRSKDRENGDWKNILMKEGEKINFRDVLAKTKEERKIILIIDESHIGATSERTNELRDEINADVILEMSATPKLMPDPKDLVRGTAGYIYVEPEDVIKQGMIKKELIINEKIDQISDDEKDSQEIVLEVAYKKRLELKKYFEKLGSNINPLVLIQIPTAEAGDSKIEAIKKFSSKKHITEKNGKLAIWLAEQKSKTVDWISEPDNEIEFLIFKQAIDTGWDCPRAHILVKFRESRSETFEIQTVGRILRMPEQKHYSIEDLNRGYIYTNVQSILVKKEEYNPNIIKHLRSVRKDCYKNIKLGSYYKSRADYGDITSSFNFVFEDVASKKFNLKTNSIKQNITKLEKQGFILDLDKFKQDIIKDTKIEARGFDKLEGEILARDMARLIIAGNDLQDMFEQIIKSNLGSFSNIKRSVPIVKTTIYQWFRKYLGSKAWDEEILLVQKIFLYQENLEKFESVLSEAIDIYKTVRDKEVQKRIKESEQFYNFEVPKESFYNQHTDERVNLDDYVYDPCYLNKERLQPERNFEEFFNLNKDKIAWCWKNGENKKDYFGIKYEYSKKIHTFYPDYLVQLKDGRLGILETKDQNDRDGKTLTKAKAESLYSYIQKYKKKKIFGGIVIKKNREWLINNKRVYNWSKCEKGDFSDWDILNTNFINNNE